ncbi:MupG family TIM beta-alpha barrel fold protein [Amphibacillus sediminis]|uniref:MupG family TIM beta-alpha barrel fold protein n=1 Tax=Amphibacillus sediminis TaxID=360185 RepID=UPI0008376E85|nr:MupG family TIM beta-alpha barrel fold protein [Amphibacillus sediminis]
MLNQLGLSVYVSTFDRQKVMLEKLIGSGSFIFTSFHIIEEVNEDYLEKARHMCEWLAQANFRIIADVSPKTLDLFHYSDIVEFAEAMQISVLRLDYGFEIEQVHKISKKFPLAFNASTLELPNELTRSDQFSLYAMHNFYPRPETGLDSELFQAINEKLIDNHVEIIAFIPGDLELRGPLKEGLPTLEKHRGWPPYLCYLDMVKNHYIQRVFIGDVLISDQELALIEQYQQDRIIQIPTQLANEHTHLYNQVFTIRIDSPKGLMRLQESRGYASQGEKEMPVNCLERKRGFVTMDNERYKRYSGEIQIMRRDYQQDDRVNVIGKIVKPYLPIVDCIKNGDRIKFIPYSP